jgi:hypothetical protein
LIGSCFAVYRCTRKLPALGIAAYYHDSRAGSRESSRGCESDPASGPGDQDNPVSEFPIVRHHRRERPASCRDLKAVLTSEHTCRLGLDLIFHQGQRAVT